MHRAQGSVVVPRRVVVTGLGALAAPGIGAASLWAALLAGDGAIASADGGLPQAAITLDIAPRFDPGRLTMLDRVSQFALLAARDAMAQARAGPGAFDPQRAGAIFGAGIGHTTLDDSYRRLYRDASPRLHPFSVPRGMPSAPASQLSMEHGLRGPSFATASACASSAHALAVAFHFVRAGVLDLALTGGAEASLVPGMIKAWEGLRVLSRDTCRPFSRDRSGLVLGEGAAALVLEDWASAEARGAEPLAEVLGVGMSADAGDITAPAVDGAVAAMQAALRDAGLGADAVDYVNAHGTGTRLNDRCESAALAQVFGARIAALPVSSSKGHFGHCLNAAGALEALVSVLALRDGMLPPTLGFREADPDCVLDCVPNVARAAAPRRALSNSFAFGGLNCSLLFGRIG